jgi:hypothetical protein
VRVEVFVRVRTELPPPPRTEPISSPQVYRPILCPYCGADRPRVLRTRPGTRYLACRGCDLYGTGGTPFKVPTAEPDEALKRLRG